MQRVNKAMYELLREWLPEEVSIYPGIASEDAQYPYCVFNPDSFQTKRTKDGVYAYVFQYSVDVWGCAFNQADRYATMIASKCEASDGKRYEEPDGRIRLVLTEGANDYTDGGFVQRMVFEVKYEGPAV